MNAALLGRRRAPYIGYAAALEWRARVTANGGTMSDRTFNAYMAFVNEVRYKSPGLWDTLKAGRMSFWCGGDGAGSTLAAAAVPAIAAKGDALDTFVNFAASDLSATTALTGAATKRVRTGLLPFTDIGATGTLGFYLRTAPSTNQRLIGARDAGPTQIYQMALSNVGAMLGNWGGAGVAAEEAPAVLGFYATTRYSDADIRLFRSGTQVDLDPGPVAPSAAVLEMYVMASNNNGTAGSYFTGECGCYLICGQIQPWEHAVLGNACNRLMEAFGWKV